MRLYTLIEAIGEKLQSQISKTATLEGKMLLLELTEAELTYLESRLGIS